MSEVPRELWARRLDSAWRRVPIVWLSGVRRVGKTSLVRQLPDATYLRGRGVADAIECRWSAQGFSPRSLAAFRTIHPKGRNFVVVPGPREPTERRHRDLTVMVTDLAGLVAALETRG